MGSLFNDLHHNQDVQFLPDDEYDVESVDLLGDSLTGLARYVSEFLLSHFGDIHPFPTYKNSSGRYHLNSGTPIPSEFTQHDVRQHFSQKSGETIKISIAADFGAGTKETDILSRLLVEGYDPHYTIHLGDVYFIGLDVEVKGHMLGIPPLNVEKAVTWPHGSLGSFALNGNHEMYSRGYAYFDILLPTLGVLNEQTGQLSGQQASYFSLENDYWRIIALDTGYNSYAEFGINSAHNPQPDEVIAWLQNTIRLQDPSDTRAIIFLSHHQYFSAFNNGYPDTAAQIAKILPQGRKALWLWGHEHRFAFYNFTSAYSIPLSMYGRCVGFSGFPVTLSDIPASAAQYQLQAYDNRVYEVDYGILPIPIGFNGFTRLNITDNLLHIEYRSLKLDPKDPTKLDETESEILVTEVWSADGHGDIQFEETVIVNPNMTIVQHF